MTKQLSVGEKIKAIKPKEKTFREKKDYHIKKLKKIFWQKVLEKELKILEDSIGKIKDLVATAIEGDLKENYIKK